MSAETTTASDELQQLFDDITAKSVEKVQQLIDQNADLATLQNQVTGESALIVASKVGDIDIVKILLSNGAVWNALDRTGKCAGNYASDGGHQDICDLLVNHAVQCELLLGQISRVGNGELHNDRQKDQYLNENGGYLETNVQYTDDGKNLIDEAGDAVMMEWERPLMNAHAQIITGNKKNRRVLNIGFGMGIIDGILQSEEFEPSLHVIVEAHPQVHEKMKKDGWLSKSNVRVMHGKWQDELPKLVDEGLTFDGIFFDTYGEHWADMEDFHDIMTKLLEKSHDSTYSFFNGLSPENIFFHGVACECARLQLLKLGMIVEYAPCEIQINSQEWDGISRKYFHNNVYYLPICKWDTSNI